MTSGKEGPARRKRSSGKHSYRVELSRAAEKALKGLSDKDMRLIGSLISIISADPFDPTHTLKLHGEWEGCRRARKGGWRVIYLSPEDDTIYVIYISGRSEKTYRK